MGKKRKYEDSSSDFSNKKFKEEDVLLGEKRDVLSSVFTLILDAFDYIYNMSEKSSITYHSNNNLQSKNVLEVIKEAGFDALHHQALYQALYQTVTNNPEYAKKIGQAFKVLQEIGFRVEQHLALYKAVIDAPWNAEEVAKAFMVLRHAGASALHHQVLYQAVIDKASYAYRLALAEAFKALQDAGFNVAQHSALYQAVINKPWDAEILADAFKVLQDAGFNVAQHQLLYQAIIDNASYSYRLAEAFKALQDAGFSVEHHLALYQAIIDKASHAKLIPYAIKSLQEAGASVEHHPALYQAVINKPWNAEILADAFKVLQDAGFNVAQYQTLYQAVIDNVLYARAVAYAIKALQEAGASVEHHQALYQAVINKSWGAEILAEAFKVLRDAGFSVAQHQALYKAVIDRASYAYRLAVAFKALQEIGFSVAQHQALYQAVTAKVLYARELAQAFKVLFEMGFSAEFHPALYQALIDEASHAKAVVYAIKALQEARASVEHHQALYQAVINKPWVAAELAEAFKALQNVGFSVTQHQMLYKAVIDKVSYAYSLAEAFKALQEIGFSVAQHKALYQTVIDKASYAYSLADAFKVLQEIGFNVAQHQALYKAVIDKALYAGKLAQAFKALQEIGFSFEYYQVVIDMPEHIVSLLFGVLTALKEIGFNSQDHAFLFHNLFHKLEDKQSSLVLVFKTVESLKQYVKSNVLLKPEDEGFNAQINAIQAHLNTEIIFAEGPLNKSSVTKEIERILETLSGYKLTDIELYFDEQWENYILKMGELPAINVSLLLKNANLSQLELSSKLMAALDKHIEAAYPAWNNVVGHLADYKIIKGKENEFPLASQKAIKLYTSPAYKNINKLFRGEILDVESERRFTLENIGKKNDKDPLLCFLLGCLINHTINQLRDLIEGTDSENVLLDRGEFLTEETINGRLSNPWHLPAVTSFSRHKEGSSYFHSPGTIRTKLENPPRILSIINSREGEVLFSQGHQVITTRGPECYIARLANSPSLERPNTVWSDLALQYALENYLSKEYRDQNSGITLDGKIIYRPNHNLPHVYRVMNAIELVLSYFSRHAKDDAFKTFSEECTAQEMEWLRVAAAFSITGRESEISAGEDLAKYDEYRAASAGHFVEFVKSTQNMEDPTIKAMTERMFHVVRYMGNPEYEQGKDGSVGINKDKNIEERQRKNFYHRILTIAHKLDLPRCYDADQYNKSMQLCLDLSLENGSQRADYLEIVRYNMELIKAHGGHLSCDLDIAGTFMDAYVPYKPIYARASSTLKQIDEISKTVTKPVARSETKRVGLAI